MGWTLTRSRATGQLSAQPRAASVPSRERAGKIPRNGVDDRVHQVRPVVRATALPGRAGQGRTHRVDQAAVRIVTSADSAPTPTFA